MRSFCLGVTLVLFKNCQIQGTVSWHFKNRTTGSRETRCSRKLHKVVITIAIARQSTVLRSCPAFSVSFSSYFAVSSSYSLEFLYLLPFFSETSSLKTCWSRPQVGGERSEPWSRISASARSLRQNSSFLHFCPAWETLVHIGVCVTLASNLHDNWKLKATVLFLKLNIHWIICFFKLSVMFEISMTGYCGITKFVNLEVVGLSRNWDKMRKLPVLHPSWVGCPSPRGRG